MDAKEFYGLSVIIIIVLVAGTAAETPLLASSVPDWFIEDFTSLDPADLRGPDEEHNVTEPIEIIVLSNNGHTIEDEISEITFILDREGILSVTVLLTWQDDIGAPDELGLELIYDGSSIESVQGTTGSLELVFDEGNETAYKGEYIVKISAIDCPGAVSILPVDRDNGNNWSLTVKATVLE